jgi:FMN phosphatase YigB (HAD superfamily)
MDTSIMRTTILFDIDHTLFDSDKYKEICFSVLGERLKQKDAEVFMALAQQEYKKIRLRGTFKPREFVNQIITQLGISGDSDDLSEIFFNEKYIDEACYPDVSEVVGLLSKNPLTTLGILSFGPDALQRKKIQSIIHMLHSDAIYINEVDKLEDIPTLLRKHAGEQMYIIDDVLNVLQRFKSLDPSVVTVLIQRDHNKKKEVPEYTADFTINNLSELLPIIN